MTVLPAHEVKSFVAGTWRRSENRTPVHNPYNGEQVAEVPLDDSATVREAVRAAESALTTEFSPHARAEVLDRVAEQIRQNEETFAQAIALEAGKPIKLARIEASRAAETLALSAIEARQLRGEVVPLEGAPGHDGRLGFTLRLPVGVVAAITPFNFPLNLAAHKLGPALAGGNAVVFKPASETPLSAVLLVEAFLDAGLPPGRLQLVNGRGSETGAALVAEPTVAAVTFTGSREIGWRIAESTPRKRHALELGATSPVIVCADADWRDAAARCAVHGYSFAGQSCISVQRVLVEDGIYEPFLEELARRVDSLIVGDPNDPSTDVGPLIRPIELARVLAWIEEATNGGAALVRGGTLTEDGLLKPTLLAEVDTTARVWGDEVFGPVVSVNPASSFLEACTMANDSEFGLQVGVFTSRLEIALEAAQRLEFGGVLINEVPTVRADLQPYGGVKESGHGREGPGWAIRELTDERFVSFQRGRS